METELVRMPKGLLAELHRLLPQMPASAFGTIPAAGVGMLVQAMQAAQVVEDPEAPEENPEG